MVKYGETSRASITPQKTDLITQRQDLQLDGGARTED
jgi:hypothetical protein